MIHSLWKEGEREKVREREGKREIERDLLTQMSNAGWHLVSQQLNVFNYF